MIILEFTFRAYRIQVFLSAFFNSHRSDALRVLIPVELAKCKGLNQALGRVRQVVAPCQVTTYRITGKPIVQIVDSDCEETFWHWERAQIGIDIT